MDLKPEAQVSITLEARQLTRWQTRFPHIPILTRGSAGLRLDSAQKARWYSLRTAAMSPDKSF